MIVEADYKGFRVEVTAAPAGHRYIAEVRLRRLFSQEKRRTEVVSCYKVTPDLAEHAGLICDYRWHVNGAATAQPENENAPGRCPGRSGRKRIATSSGGLLPSEWC